MLWVDALYEKVRFNGRVVSIASLLVCGVNSEGKREVLSIKPMLEESAESYTQLFTQLKTRGLATPALIVSDARFGLPSIQAFFQGGGLAETATGNVWLYMAKCPVFGEFSYNICGVCKMLMVAAHAAIILLAIIAIVYTAIDSIRKWNIIWIFVLLTGLSVITAYFVFIVRYPFYCSLDFRYIVPVSLCGALCIGNLYNKADGTDRKFALYCDTVNISTILFAVTSIVMYTNLPS